MKKLFFASVILLSFGLQACSSSDLENVELLGLTINTSPSSINLSLENQNNTEVDVLANIFFLDENVNELLNDNTIYDQGAQLMGTLPVDDIYQLGLMLEGQTESNSDLDVENYDVTLFLLDENGDITDERLFNVRN